LPRRGNPTWFWIPLSRRRDSLSVTYATEATRRFKLPFGTLAIEHDLTGPYFGESRHYKVRLTESASIKVTAKAGMSLQDVQDYQRNLEELLILLTSSNRNVDWPTLYMWNGKQRAKFYFQRTLSKDEPPEAYDCLIGFPKIADAFGTLFATLREKRDQYGPGIYLYLGTRRGMPMFVEHRFVNLIWGLEALDRHGRGDMPIAAPKQEKIDRIVAQVSATNDRRWLRQKLKNAAEPSLAERLFATFSALALPLDRAKLKSFCEQCQRRRNDISHFGGLRQRDASYSDFMHELDEMSDALAALYHLHLLTLIGVDAANFDFARNKNWPLWRIERSLRAVGLLAPSPETAATA